MLILTRKLNEKIFIGEDIALVIVGIENNRVKLGIDAPADVTILREEILDKSKNLKIDAALHTNSEIDDKSALKTGTG